MRLNVLDMLAQRIIEGDALRTKNELMKALPVAGVDGQPRAYVKIDKSVIEDCNVGDVSVPRAVLENGMRGSACAVDDDARRVVSPEPVPLANRERIVRGKGPQNG